MGQRGPRPSSGVMYTTRDGIQLDVVIRAHGAPYVLWPGHPLAISHGYVPVLRLAASDAGLGLDKHRQPTRWVTRGQAVLPIDGDPWNWAVSNLQVQPLAASLPHPTRRRSRHAPKAAKRPRPAPR